jgi:hypothetical protein
VHDAEHVLHRPVGAHDVVEPEAVAELLAEHPVLAHEMGPLHGPAQDHQQLVLLEGLGQVIESALAHGVHGAVDGAVGGHEDHEGRLRELHDLAQQLDALRSGILRSVKTTSKAWACAACRAWRPLPAAVVS